MEKPAEILKLEKFYNITLLEKNYVLNENNQIVILDLSENQISNIEPLKNLKSLESLYLYDNQISNIEPLIELKSLTTLSLFSNQITDIEPLKGLKSLRLLYLDNNQISNIEPLKELKSLVILGLFDNQIIDIKPLEELLALKEVDVGINKISDISVVKELLLKLHYLERLSIFDNPFLENIDLNLEIGSKVNNLIDLKNYFSKEDENNKIKYLLPAKIMLLGNHLSGKSTFLNNFFNEKKQDNLSTHILNIRHYKKSTKADILPEAIFFDFGGQDYYHGVYKAFMTNDSTNLLFWQQDTDNNKIGIDKSARNNHTQNFNRKYWIKQLKHYENKKDENIIWLIQTHLDKDGHKKSWINSESMSKNIVNEFHTSFESAKYESSLNYLKSSLDEEIKEKRIEVVQPTWYKEFLQYILASTSYKSTSLTVIKKNYKRENIIDEYFRNDLEQLSRQGLILYYPNIKKLKNVAWLNPSKIIKYIYKKILSEEKISKYNGIVPKYDFEELCDEKLRLMLVENRVIFFDETEGKYIIPSYLPRAQEDGNDFFFFFDFSKANFILKFRDFIPFGFINQLICAYGQTKELKKYWRDMLMFTVDDKKIKIFIKLDFEELKIEVFINANKDISKQKVAEIERIIFEDILAFYYDKSSYQSILVNNEIKKQEIDHKERVIEQKIPDDIYLSVNSDYYVKYSTLEDEKTTNTILAYKNMDKQNSLTIFTRAFKNFTDNRNIGKMKKIFVSYSRKDFEFRDELRKHLGMLKMFNIADNWACEDMEIGKWHEQIQNELEDSDLIIYMLSANFFSSAYIIEQEVIKGMEFIAQNSNKKILPIIVSDFVGLDKIKKAMNSEIDVKQEKILGLGDFQYLAYGKDINPLTQNGEEKILTLKDFANRNELEKALSQICEKIIEIFKY